MDINTVIQDFGGPNKISVMAKEHLDITLTNKAVQKWRERNSLPLIWIVRLKDIAAKENITTELTEYKL